MAGHTQGFGGTDRFDLYFRRADLDGDGRISGAEAIAFFKGSNLSKQVLAQVWMHADKTQSGFLNRSDFYNALKLVTVAQSKRDLTPDIVKAALYSPASAKIPAPQINLVPPSSQLNSKTPLPPTKLSSVVPASSPDVFISRSQSSVTTDINQQFTLQSNSLIVQPSPVTSAGIHTQNQQGPPGLGISGTTSMASRSIPNIASTDWMRGNMGSTLPGVGSQATFGSVINSPAQVGFGMAAPSFISSTSVMNSSAEIGFGMVAPSPTSNTALQPAINVGTGLTANASFSSRNSYTSLDSNTQVISGNGFFSHSGSRDFAPVVHSQSKPPVALSSISPAISQSTFNSMQSDNADGSLMNKPPIAIGGHLQRIQSTVKENIQNPVQTAAAFKSPGLDKGTGVYSSHMHTPWPKITQTDVQKYTKVFMEVDTDKDGKISGVQARNLFLSWRLPREVLKLVWDLSDQDNDAMLSHREFCIALYLIERCREGFAIPTVLPNNIMLDETLSLFTGQSVTASASQQLKGFPRTQSTISGGGTNPPNQESDPFKVLPQAQGFPTTQTPVPSFREPVLSNQEFDPPESKTVPSSPPKSRAPVLEKYIVDQLDKDEQNALNSKFQEASEADKKVEELEKEILESKQKIAFYQTKMQELIIYKSRCDNRLNELTERSSAERNEAELLLKKYEDKYKEVGDVLSKLTMDEASFRDIQMRKMDLYQTIAKMEPGCASASGSFQDYADHIQSDIDELLKSLNECCKKYGLRAKPTTLTELPFGWQPGIQEVAADWDEDWDKFEEEGFTFVKELTLDVQNIIVPPKMASSLPQQQTVATNDSSAALVSKENDKPDTAPHFVKEFTGKETADDQSKHGLVNSQPGSPSDTVESSFFEESVGVIQTGHVDSPHDRDTQSDHGGLESTFSDSANKNFDDLGWGTFDNDPDTTNWGFNPSTKGGEEEKHEGSFFDSSPDGGFNLDTYQRNSYSFANSIPGTPTAVNSPSRFSEAARGEPSFDGFSRFDSFGVNEEGGRFSRFDSFGVNEEGGRFSDYSTQSTTAPNHVREFSYSDDPDPFGTSLFKSSLESRTRGSDNWSAF